VTRTWFITGGSAGGFGSAFAEAALDLGDRVILTARRVAAVQPDDRMTVLPLDVTDAAQIAAAVEAAGDIDVLVNNAGRGWYGSIEAMPEDAVRRTFELNLFGLLAVTRAVLPGMRRRGAGWIVNMSSVAGLRAVPGFGYYSAAKYAVEGVTEALRAEVEPFGIRVMAVEPGAFRTRAYSGFAAETVEEGAYRPMVERVRAGMVAQDGHQPGDPARGARAVIAAMDRPTPPRRLVLGGAAFDTVTEALQQNLADIRSSEHLSRGADTPQT
jgi:NAD(P)-dependent dehydrogenase (short-subunit alcohol dehydrogenase family)